MKDQLKEFLKVQEGLVVEREKLTEPLLSAVAVAETCLKKGMIKCREERLP